VYGGGIRLGPGHNALIKGPDGKRSRRSGKTARRRSSPSRQERAADRQGSRDNGWFVFFRAARHPQIAGVVFLEHGVHGSNAALIAHHVLDTFFAKKDGRPLPPKPELKANLVP